MKPKLTNGLVTIVEKNYIQEQPDVQYSIDFNKVKESQTTKIIKFFKNIFAKQRK